MNFQLSAITDKYSAGGLVYMQMSVDGIVSTTAIPLDLFNSKETCISSLVEAVKNLATDCYSKNRASNDC